VDLSQTDKLFWLSRTRRVGVFIVAALDADASAYGVGGFVADQTEWNKFEAVWTPTRERLAAAGKTFHMTDCELGHNDFSGMDRNTERVPIIKALVDSIVSAKMWAIHTAIQVPVFNAVFPGEGERSMYYLCFASIVRELALIGNDNNEPVAFAFEQKAPFEFMCLAIYEEMKRQTAWPGSRRLGTIGFYKKGDLDALSAADLLAYEGVKVLSETLNPSGRPLRRSMARIRDTERLRGRQWDEPALKEVRGFVDAHGKKTLRDFFESITPSVMKELQAAWTKRPR